MNKPMRRRALLQMGLAIPAAATLPRPARACEFFAPNLRIYRPWSRATATGDAFAVLCMTFDEVTLADRLLEVRTPVAERVVLQREGHATPVDLALPIGTSTELDEGGLHLRLLGLKHPLGVGRNYPLEVRFERGGTVVGDFDVIYERLDG
jgi:copper(I)-binding protein